MTAVDFLHRDYSIIIDYLKETNQPSFASDLDKHFKKNLILSAASFFETEIQDILVNFVSNVSLNDMRVVSFLKKKGINMQYHTYFNWGEKNEPGKPGKDANAFFSLFGEEFKSHCAKEIEADPNLDSGVKAFIEIGHLRNILVHSNFAAVNFDTKTTEEIYNLYKMASFFILYLKRKF